MKRARLAVIVILLSGVGFGGWRWHMQQGAHVNAGFVQLDAGQEFPDAVENELVRAVARGDLGAVELLVGRGANVNAVSAFLRVTPLMWAVMARDLASIRVLLSFGADPNYRVPLLPGTHPLDRRKENALWGDSAISLAIFNNDIAALELLLDKGGNPNIEGQGPAPIFEIRQLPGGRINPMLELILKHGADVDIRGAGNATLLSYMISRGQFETAIYLLEKGADPHLLVRKQGVPCTSYPTGTLWREDDFLYINYGAAQLQRITGPDGSGGDEVSCRLRRMFEERGVKMPFWDPDSIRGLQSPPLAKLRERGTPDEVIRKIIRLNKAKEIEQLGAGIDEWVANGYAYGHILEREYRADQKRQ